MTCSDTLRDDEAHTLAVGLMVRPEYSLETESFLFAQPRRPVPVENLPVWYRIAARLCPSAWDFWSQYHIQRHYRERGSIYAVKASGDIAMYSFGIQAFTNRTRSLSTADVILQIVRDTD